MNGTVEPPQWTIFTDRDHLLRWAWRTVVRLCSRSDVRAWLHGPLARYAVGAATECAHQPGSKRRAAAGRRRTRR